jgi:hypothetical protein
MMARSGDAQVIGGVSLDISRMLVALFRQMEVG